MSTKCQYSPLISIGLEYSAVIVPRHDQPQHHGHDAEADDHVQRVQAGHHEVEREEDLRVPDVLAARTGSRGRARGARRTSCRYSNALMPRNAVPRIIVTTRNSISSRRSPSLRRVHRQRHRQAAGDQHGRVDRAEPRRRSSWLAAAKASGYQLR